jgi:hypothetical protein
MTELLEKFKDCTLILLKTPFDSEIPTKGEVKTLLGVEDVFYYKRRGPYGDDIRCMELALHITENSSTPLIEYSNYITKCTSIVVTNAGVNRGSFLKLKYPSNVVDGFCLNQQSWAELTDILERYKVSIAVCKSFENWFRSAKYNAHIFNDHAIIDSTVTDLDLNALLIQQQTYGVSALQSIQQDAKAWVTQYRWQ